jgi:hypothetical protein
MAAHLGTLDNYLFQVKGVGLGDVICSEPTIRYALDTFKNVKISVETTHPDVFRHLESRLHKLFKVGGDYREKYNDYRIFETAVGEDDIRWEFLDMAFMHCIDAASMCSMRMQLPVSHRQINLVPDENAKDSVKEILHQHDLLESENRIVIHPGKTWPSRTLPADWWDEIIQILIKGGVKPVIIGAQCVNGNSTVDIDARGCVDLRESLSFMQSVALLQMADLVLTNDSAPLHMAASGNAWIGFFATARHPDHLTHWRRGMYGHKTKNLSLGGMWSFMDLRPGQSETKRYDLVEESLVRSWLPTPSAVADWTFNALRD